MKPNIEFLAARAYLLRRLRAFFDNRGFLEVQPPCLSRDCVVDPYIDPITVPTPQFGLTVGDLPSTLYLQTSPELAMKRMLAAGSSSIYSIGPVFRAGERGPHHNPEFTMLEWYDVGADMRQGVDLLGNLVTEILQADRFDVCTYRELFRRFIEVDPLETPVTHLHEIAMSMDQNLADSLADDRDSLLDVLLSQRIAPSLGHQRPQIVTEYPLSQAALARQSNSDPECAARFELFASGIELANGYDELLDADVLVDRASQSNRKRIATGRLPMKVESSLATAMRDGLPPCAGVALGVDRLLAIQVGVRSIDEVISFPIEIA